MLLTSARNNFRIVNILIGILLATILSVCLQCQAKALENPVPGSFEWVHQFGSGNVFSWSKALWLSGDDNALYLVRTEYAPFPDPNRDILIQKFSKNGNKLWSKQIDIQTCDYVIESELGPDNSLYILVTCYEPPNIGVKTYIKRFDENGNETWSCLIGTGDDVSALTIDKAGNCIFAIDDYTSTGPDTTIRKINTQGQEIWSCYIGAHEIGKASVDSLGNVIVVEDQGFNELSGVSVWKIDHNGVIVWKSRFGSADVPGRVEFTNRVHDMAIDDLNNIYICGMSECWHNIEYVGFLEKFDSDGNELWNNALWYQVGSNQATASAVVVGADGHINVCGQGYMYPYISGYDALLAEYDPEGNQLSNTSFGTVAADTAYDLFVDSSNNKYMAGATSGVFPGEQQTSEYMTFLGKLSSNSANTQIGDSVNVDLEHQIHLVFEHVGTSGNTITTQTSPPQGPPSGFRFRGSSYDITTTAEYSGSITITFTYDESEVPGNENNIKLFHWTDSRWEDCTTSVDTVNNKITGQVTSLSPFAVGYPVSASGPVVSTGYNTYQLGIIGLAFLVSGLWFVRRRAIA